MTSSKLRIYYFQIKIPIPGSLATSTGCGVFEEDEGDNDLIRHAYIITESPKIRYGNPNMTFFGQSNITRDIDPGDPGDNIWGEDNNDDPGLAFI